MVCSWENISRRWTQAPQSCDVVLTVDKSAKAGCGSLHSFLLYDFGSSLADLREDTLLRALSKGSKQIDIVLHFRLIGPCHSTLKPLVHGRLCCYHYTAKNGGLQLPLTSVGESFTDATKAISSHSVGCAPATTLTVGSGLMKPPMVASKNGDVHWRLPSPLFQFPLSIIGISVPSLISRI